MALLHLRQRSTRLTVCRGTQRRQGGRRVGLQPGRLRDGRAGNQVGMNGDRVISPPISENGIGEAPSGGRTVAWGALLRIQRWGWLNVCAARWASSL